MTDIYDIDIEDIINLLSVNNIEIPKIKDEIYKIAFDLMNKKSTSYNNVPASIIEWMLAYNVLQSNMVIDFL